MALAISMISLSSFSPWLCIYMYSCALDKQCVYIVYSYTGTPFTLCMYIHSLCIYILASHVNMQGLHNHIILHNDKVTCTIVQHAG